MIGHTGPGHGPADGSRCGSSRPLRAVAPPRRIGRRTREAPGRGQADKARRGHSGPEASGPDADRPNGGSRRWTFGLGGGLRHMDRKLTGVMSTPATPGRAGNRGDRQDDWRRFARRRRPAQGQVDITGSSWCGPRRRLNEAPRHSRQLEEFRHRRKLQTQLGTATNVAETSAWSHLREGQARSRVTPMKERGRTRGGPSRRPATGVFHLPPRGRDRRSVFTGRGAS